MYVHEYTSSAVLASPEDENSTKANPLATPDVLCLGKLQEQTIIHNKPKDIQNEWIEIRKHYQKLEI